MSRRGGCSLLLAFALGCVVPPGGAPSPAPRLPPVADGPGRPAQLVVISVAGGTADRFLDPGVMPVLAALASRGVAAEQVETVAGAGVYPAHASLVTGVVPAEHGIVADHLLGERGVRRAAPSHASQLRAATLWQRVAESGGSVTSLDWPTTTGAEIAGLLPDGVVIANRNYTRLGQGPGMLTDMGRVFVRYGEPSEVLRQVIPSGDNTLLQALREIRVSEDRALGDVEQKGPGGDMRPFEVWIYEGDIPPPVDADPREKRVHRKRLVFLFVDEMGLGQYTMRYSTE